MIALKEDKIPARKACQIVGIHRSTFRKKLKGPRYDADLRTALLELSNHPYRRGLPWMLQRLRKQGFSDNHKRVERVYQEENLQLPRKKPKARYRGPETARLRAEYLNHIWAADFMSDSTQSGRYGRILNLLDEHSRKSLDIHCATSITGKKVEEIFDRAIEYRGTAPEILVVDNGPEFICHVLEDWAQRHSVRIHFIQKGKPTQNCFVESFNSIMRREFLNKHWFYNIRELEAAVQEYRRYYNEDREHSSLGWMTPEEYETSLLSAPLPTAAPQTTSDQMFTI